MDVYVGEVISNQEELVPYGSFIISKSKDKTTQGNSSYTGYDYMIKTEQAYPMNDSIAYPKTLQEYLSTILPRIGIQLGNTTFVNSNYQLLGNAYMNGESYRTIIGEIAKVCGGFAKIGRDNKLYLVTLGVDEEIDNALTINSSQYFDEMVQNENNTYGPVNRVIVALDDNVEGEYVYRQDQTSIEQNGLTEIKISAISFLTSEGEREKVVNGLWNALKNLKYHAFSGDYYGFPYIDAGDSFKINELKTYIFNHEFTYNGGFSGNLETSAITKTETTYGTVTSAKNVFKRTELLVDKINGQITSVIETVDEQNSSISQINQTVEEIKSDVTNMIDLTGKKEGYFNSIELEDCTAGDIYGLRIYSPAFTGLYPKTDLYPSETLYPQTCRYHIYVDYFDEDSIQKTDEYGVMEWNEDENKYLPIRELKTVEKDGEIFREVFVIDITRRDVENKVYVTRYTKLVNGRIEYLPAPVDTTNVRLFKIKSGQEIPENTIGLHDGTNTVRFEDGMSANVLLQYIKKSPYTDAFATHYEVSSSIEQKADEISLSVNEKIALVEEDYTEKFAEIKQTTDSITSRVGSVESTTGRLTNNYTQIKQTVDSINQSVVYKNNVVANINTAVSNGQGIIDISGNKIKIKSDTFELTETGSISATAGKIAGFRIVNNILENYENSSFGAGIAPNEQITFYIKNNNELVFTAQMDGAVTCKTLSVNNSVPIMSLSEVSSSAQIVRQIYKNGGVMAFFHKDGTTNTITLDGASDRALKENIEPSQTNAIDILNELELVQFDWKDSGKHEDIGFIAQDICEIDNKFAYEAPDGLYRLSLQNMIPYLVKATQELSSKNNELENRIKELEDIIKG